MSITNWLEVAPAEQRGAAGRVVSRTRTFGDLRVRMVEYSPGYVADHWCTKGHVILCLSGTLEIDLQDGKHLRLEQNESCHVGDGDPGHRAAAPNGATVFIVD